MPPATVTLPAFPNVPQAPGVPPMVRVGQVIGAATLLVSDAASLIKAFQGPQWGIFDQLGNPVIIGDSVVAVDYRREYRVSDYPVEQGGFASYDKVQMPFDVRVTFAVSGQGSLLSSLLSGGALGALISGSDPDVANRTAFLTAMETAAAALYLFTVVTPEASYKSCNIVHYDYRREAKKGAALITVEVWLIEVRVTATAQFTQTQTQSPASADPQSGGTVQPAAPSPAQAAALPTPPIPPPVDNPANVVQIAVPPDLGGGPILST
jgi:hypothetical protein